jgi:hypothetical protein
MIHAAGPPSSPFGIWSGVAPLLRPAAVFADVKSTLGLQSYPNLQIKWLPPLGRGRIQSRLSFSAAAGIHGMLCGEIALEM